MDTLKNEKMYLLQSTPGHLLDSVIFLLGVIMKMIKNSCSSVLNFHFHKGRNSTDKFKGPRNLKVKYIEIWSMDMKKSIIQESRSEPPYIGTLEMAGLIPQSLNWLKHLLQWHQVTSIVDVTGSDRVE